MTLRLTNSNPNHLTLRQPTAPSERATRIALYSHDTQGLGHLRRNLLIASSLVRVTPRPTILLIGGAREVGAFNIPPGVDCLTVPSLSKSETGGYGVRSLDVSLAELVHMRRTAMLAGLRAFDPDLFIVDKVPLGAQDELEPSLEWLRRRGRAACVLGLREVLDEPAVAKREWARDRCDASIAKFYDQVWVYGDPSIYDTAREYAIHASTSAKIRHTGYLNPLDAAEHTTTGRPTQGDDMELASGERFVLCAVGGGQDGAELAMAFAQARSPQGVKRVVVTGPFMPSEVRMRLRALAESDATLIVKEFITEPYRLMGRAARIICMGGYNTVCEALAFRCPTLVVPRVKPRQEQWIRAERMRRRGLLDVQHPEALSSESLSAWMARTDHRGPDARAASLRFDGLRRIPALAQELLAPAACAKEAAGARV